MNTSMTTPMDESKVPEPWQHGIRPLGALILLLSMSAPAWAVLPPDCEPQWVQDGATAQPSAQTAVAAAGICDPEEPPPPPVRAASFISQSVPAKMVAGQSYSVSVVMRNNGSATWTSAAGYRLGSQNPGDNTTWGGHRVALPASIASGQDAGFNFPVTAPASAGTYNFQWRMVQDGVAWFGTSTANQSINVVTSAVDGYVDGVGGNAILGWACASHVEASIVVHAYAGGPYGTGTGIGAYTANQASEPSIAAVCKTSGTAYRFSIPITQAMITEHGGKTIYVYGISPVGTPAILLGNSGTHRLPVNQAPSVSLTGPADGAVVAEATGTVQLTAIASDADDGVASVSFYDGTQLLGTDNTAPYEFAWSNIGAGAHTVQAKVTDTRGAVSASATRTVKVSRVIGDIGGVTTGNLLWGWACSTFVDASIPVHLYVGGPAGSGTGVGSYTANVASDAAVANACQANGTAYIFHIPITQTMVTAHGGKAIYVHGISPFGGSNNTIGNSGTYSIPGNQPPTVTLTSPTNGASVTVPGNFTLTATASDADDGLAAVDFYNGSTLLVTDSIAPYHHVVGDLAVGNYTFKAIARDTRGATASSQVMEGRVTGGSSPPQLVPVRRKYVYDAHQQLCKVIEPETGVTVMDYDGAGNLQWSAAGLALTDETRCDTLEGRDSGRKVTRLYDNRHRLSSLSFPDGLGNQSWTYTADGLPATITTYNGANNSLPVLNTYTYSQDPRRLLTAETSGQPGWYTWGIGYGYDAYGHLASQSYPDGVSVTYAPNALGQPTQAGTYATGVSYYPNGAIKQFTYGNGIVHAMTQNARQLPSRSTDGTTLDLGYQYDKAGNVGVITDYVNGRQNRNMAYDAMNRLVSTASNMFGAATYTYNHQDNIYTAKVTGGSQARDYAYVYDANQRLTNITQGVDGATVVGLAYDVQGNVANKNGQVFRFDYGNRLREATGKETYHYDGHGRRIESRTPANVYVEWQYSNAGQVTYSHDHRNNQRTNYIYLGGSLVALREGSFSNGDFVTKYQHTDALGSPTAVTNTSGVVIETSEYEPYGQLVNRALTDGPGFTGHVQDAATGLTYMQQRYYDPTLGRFLSTDPVQADPNTGASFNRYWYANNNPYKFTDPDGRTVQYAVGGTVNEAQLRSFLIKMAFSPTGRGEFQQLELSKTAYTFQLDSRASNWFDQTSNTVYVNPVSYKIIQSSGETLAPELIGIHEVSHAAEYDRVGADAFNQALQPTFTPTTNPNGNTVVTPGTSPEEARATKIEQNAAGEIGLPARQNYQDTCRRGDDGC